MEYAKAVEDYLSELARRGVRPQTIQGYRRALLRFLRGRPPDAPLNWAAVAGWREQLLELGYRPRTVNVFLSAARGLMGYLALGEEPPLRLTGLPEPERPRLSRPEYRRLLSAARNAGREQDYLLIKALAVLGLPVSGLSRLTAEAVEAGSLVPVPGEAARPIPESLRGELRDYLRREGIVSGPVLRAARGGPLARSTVNDMLHRTAAAAGVPPERVNPRCLRQLWADTWSVVRSSLDYLAAQSYDALLEQERRICGWDGGDDPA